MSANSSTSTRERSALLLASSIKRSLGSGELSDVQFTIGLQFGQPKYFRAHNSVFCAMFYGKLAERSDHDIDIPDIIPDAFDNMLSFLYTDNVDNLDMDNVIQTLMCADKYDLPLLVDICCDFIRAQLCVDNCLALLNNAVGLRADVIVEPCLDFIDRNADAVLLSERFAAVDQKTVVMILRRDTLSAAENNVYLAVEKYCTF
ncbi:BTB/POZ domain-containing protein 3-like [Paramacrobiotus metropolitanus]|uniref:BTB/POZ domain-containing protein 3-like n=1 Tax=Paramacrobiotus metropolitanus TaxID=2943436 RepID=UPI00244635E9|nr:BTB/POZ domain-containing protein 3-like [Paramacrobiotus metropolitanus]